MKELYDGLAEILEIDPGLVNADLALTDHGWDSLAIVSTMALVDDLYGALLNGQALLRCAKVRDIEALIAERRGG